VFSVVTSPRRRSWPRERFVNGRVTRAEQRDDEKNAAISAGYAGIYWHLWAIVGDFLNLTDYYRNLPESWAFVGDFRYLWAISGFDALCFGCCAGLLG
jgi:hypothetical protein